MNEWSVHGDAAGIFSNIFVADLAWETSGATSEHDMRAPSYSPS